MDHCHITGKYRRSAHSECNLQLSIKAKQMHISVLFHNRTNYDNHLIMQGLGALEIHQPLNCIPKNFEKYLSFRIGNLRFIDTTEFMKISLEKFAENIGSVNCTNFKCNHLFRIDKDSCFGNVDKFKITKRHVPEHLLKYYLRKGIFPYDWFDSLEKFNETELPPKRAFYSKLHERDITELDYRYAKKV